MQPHEGELSGFFAEFDQGAAIPSVDAAAMKQLSEAVSRMASEGLPKPNMAMGLGAYAACGFDARQLGPQQFWALFERQNLLAALVQRGVLTEYMREEKSSERVYLAAATIPCNKEDIAESLVQLHLSQLSPEIADQSKQQMRQQGYDPDKPKIDGKFVAWLRDNC